MPKVITIDSATLAQVRLTTDGSGAVRLYCDYTLFSGPTPIQALSEDVTALLGTGDQGVSARSFQDDPPGAECFAGCSREWAVVRKRQPTEHAAGDPGPAIGVSASRR